MWEARRHVGCGLSATCLLLLQRCTVCETVLCGWTTGLVNVDVLFLHSVHGPPAATLYLACSACSSSVSPEGHVLCPLQFRLALKREHGAICESFFIVTPCQDVASHESSAGDPVGSCKAPGKALWSHYARPSNHIKRGSRQGSRLPEARGSLTAVFWSTAPPTYPLRWNVSTYPVLSSPVILYA